MKWRFEIRSVARHDEGSTSGDAGEGEATCLFVLRMSNGRKALTSEPFATLDACIDAIYGLKARVGHPRTWVRMRASAGEYFVVAVNATQDLIATGPRFRSTSARAAAVLAITTMAVEAPVVDLRGEPDLA